MKVLIDGLIFQLQSGAPRGVSRIWSSVIPALVSRYPDVEFHIIDRVDSPVSNLPGLVHHKAPVLFGAAVESVQLTRIVKDIKADWFLSTYYSIQYEAPSIMLVYDLIPEELGWDMSGLEWTRKVKTLERASRYVCISKHTARSLSKFYGIEEDKILIRYCGVDTNIFKPMYNLDSFRQEMGLLKPFFIMSGSRSLYKNGELASRAVTLSDTKTELVCVGGEPFENDYLSRYIPWTADPNVMAKMYNCAEALLFPSLAEGFGLPVLEAMACNCPVLASDIPVIHEFGGQVVQYLPPRDANAWAAAIRSFEKKDTSGPAQSSQFSWYDIADGLMESLA
jgi:glycosyltransferase involved in cell wall biosynthesis